MNTEYWTARFQQKLQDPRLYVQWNDQTKRFEIRRRDHGKPRQPTDYLVHEIETEDGGFRPVGEDIIYHLHKIDRWKHPLNVKQMNARNAARKKAALLVNPDEVAKYYEARKKHRLYSLPK